jgi:hypothetical protein
MHNHSDPNKMAELDYGSEIYFLAPLFAVKANEGVGRQISLKFRLFQSKERSIRMLSIQTFAVKSKAFVKIEGDKQTFDMLEAFSYLRTSKDSDGDLDVPVLEVCSTATTCWTAVVVLIYTSVVEIRFMLRV